MKCSNTFGLLTKTTVQVSLEVDELASGLKDCSNNSSNSDASPFLSCELGGNKLSEYATGSMYAMISFGLL